MRFETMFCAIFCMTVGAATLTVSGCSCNDDMFPEDDAAMDTDAAMGTDGSPGACGDGVVMPPSEVCDDGNNVDGDGCSADCASDETCGNRIIDTAAGEVCDDGNTMDGDECSADCSISLACGNGMPDGVEECDDGNLMNGDGCENDCSWTCTIDADCADSDTCDGVETCTNPSTLTSRCGAGLAPADGTMCDDGVPGRDICLMMSCVTSRCGDGFRDTGTTPPEECDDGNTTSDDGCSSTCLFDGVRPPAFRMTNLDLISPRIVIDAFGCDDVTQVPLFGFSVNGQIDEAIRPVSMGGSYSLHIVNLFRPLDPAMAVTATELHMNAACMEAPTPDSCVPNPMPDLTTSNANNRSAGTCFMADPAQVNTRAGTPAAYAPAVNTVGAPCFVTDEQTLTITLTGIRIPLRRARVAATYSGVPPNRLVTGVVSGFLDEVTAADIVLPLSLPLVGGDALYEHLQAGDRSVTNSMGVSIPDACNVGGGTHEDDADMNGTVRGFWFFLNFEAELIDWAGP